MAGHDWSGMESLAEEARFRRHLETRAVPRTSATEADGKTRERTVVMTIKTPRSTVTITIRSKL